MFYIYSGCYRSNLYQFYRFRRGGERLSINLTKYAWFLKWYLQPCFLRLKALITWPSLHSSYPPENSQKLIIAIWEAFSTAYTQTSGLADFLFLVFSFPFLKGFASISTFLSEAGEESPKKVISPNLLKLFIVHDDQENEAWCWMTHTASWAHSPEVYTSTLSLAREEILRVSSVTERLLLTDQGLTYAQIYQYFTSELLWETQFQCSRYTPDLS